MHSGFLDVPEQEALFTNCNPSARAQASMMTILESLIHRGLMYG